ncbi:MAG: FKBP-type peptidyl-prolyl cis-trans isomerase [Verrucomicrobia bacterium]|nr:FKBP-type peptidyl-prolyl cis-trans isomerase [Verrucomicrobiota bacterium]
MFKYLFTILGVTSLIAEEAAPKTEETAPPVKTEVAQVAKISEAFGHLIGKNLESTGYKFDVAQVIKGLQDAAAGKDAPMTEKECVQAITAAQEAAYKNQSEENLKKANEFLEGNSQKEGVVTVEPGKLQYKIEQTGTGAVVEEHFSPLIRYKGMFVDGTVFDSSKDEELISLDETIPGFTKGIIGMKEGEKRTLFIHPELGYGTSGYLPPNSLISFEIEVVKANTPPEQSTESLSSHPKELTNPEIALPSIDSPPAVR